MEFPVWIIPTSTLSLLSSFNCFAISAFLSYFNLFEKYVLNPKKLATPPMAVTSITARILANMALAPNLLFFFSAMFLLLPFINFV